MADLPNDPDAVALALNSLGLAVEEMDVVGVPIAGVVTARIVRMEKHPDAAKVTRCFVDAGDGEILLTVPQVKSIPAPPPPDSLIPFVKDSDYLKNGSLKRDLDLKLNSSDGKFDYTLYKTPNKWEDFYDHSTADFVYNKYQGYFDYFGYDKNSWKKI